MFVLRGSTVYSEGLCVHVREVPPVVGQLQAPGVPGVAGG